MKSKKNKKPQNNPGITLNRKKLSDAVKEKRSQEERALRELEGEIRVGSATLCRIERGETSAPDVEHLFAICQWLRRPPESFFNGISTPLRSRAHHKTKVNASLPPPSLEEDGKMEFRDLCEDLMPDQDDYFTVTVQGDSMIGAQIYDGDLLIARKGVEANSGDIVIAGIDGQYCVKIFDKKSDPISLLSANDGYEPIPVNEGAEFRILGVVKYSVHRQHGEGPVIP